MAVSMDGIANLSPELQRAFAQAVTAERKPIQKIVENKTKVEDRLKLVNDVIGRVDAVKNLMTGLDSPFALRELAVGTSDANALTGTADKRLAAPGTHNIEVLRLASSASALSNGFPDKDETTFGSGFFSFTTASGETKEFFIEDDNATLTGVAERLNAARIGLKASVVNDQTDPENPYRLVLVADGTGALNDVQYPEFYFMDGASEFYIEQERPAQNSLIRYEGQEIQTPSNEVPDLIPGVTINLKGLTGDGRPAALTINQDIPKTTEKVKTLVEKLNGVFSFIQQQNKMDEKTDTTVTLGGESSLRVTESRLRNVLGQVRFEEGTIIHSMGDVGVQFQKDGTLKFDEKKFEAAINANYREVVEFLAGTDERAGLFTTLSRTLSTIAGPQGSVLNGLRDVETDKQKRFQKDIESREKTADKKTEELKMKLSRMQTALNSLQRQSQAIASSGMQGNGIEAALMG